MAPGGPLSGTAGKGGPGKGKRRSSRGSRAHRIGLEGRRGQLAMGGWETPVRLPWLGAAAGSIAVGVPLGQSRFYPWSSAGIPARMGLSRAVAFGSRWWTTAGAVFVTHGGPGDEELGPEAFPNGWHTRLEILRRGGALDLQASWERRAR